MKFNYVRIIALFIVLVSTGVFTSCSSLSNDNEKNAIDAAFVGNWKLVDVKLTGEVADEDEFAGFSIALNSGGTYILKNPKGYTSPTAAAGSYKSDGQFITFENTSVHLLSLSGNTMVWEWQVAKPGKVTATYTYTFERM